MRVIDDSVPESDCLEDAPHPRFARTLVGQGEAEGELLQAWRSQRMSHAMILGGPEGIGKATLAWRFAKFIMAHPDPAMRVAQEASDLSVAPENVAVRRVEAMSHGDIALLRPQWNPKTKKHYTDIRVDEVRTALHLFQQASGAGGYRICIVDCAEELNRSSANALLKIIEEPPPKSLFLIISHAPARMMATLRSRCHKLRLEPLAPASIAAIIAGLGPPWSAAAPADIEAAALGAHGSVRAALGNLSPEGQIVRRQLSGLLQQLPDVNWRVVLKMAEKSTGRDGLPQFNAMLEAMLDWLNARVHDADMTPAQLVPYAEVWEKLRGRARDVETYNLDRRPLVLSAFAELADAVRQAQAPSRD